MDNQPPAPESPDRRTSRPSPTPAARLWHGTAGLANVAATASWRLTKWATETTVQTTHQILKGATAGESLARIAADAAAGLTTITRDMFGSSSPGGNQHPPARIDSGSSSAGRHPHSGPEDPSVPDAAPGELRERGDHLLDRSADVDDADGPHPAYQRILPELAPDEARILRLLAVSGPQPSVDVRTARPLGRGVETIAAGLTMIGELVGCRHVERTHAYLNNLNRLGLVWFSKEPVSPGRYQVIEVQPAVLE
ncbi:MAG: Abi-alpha family protein, partial [Mycobacterium sp.]